MTQLLVLGAVILAVGPFTMTAEEIRSADAIFPAHTIEGWQIASAELPEGFVPAQYEWNGALVPKELASAPVVPDRIPMLNAHLELIESGWMPSVNTFIEAMPEPDQSLARAYLVQALTMARDHPLVKAFPAAVGKTEAEVDQLFIRAGARNV